MKIEDRRCSKSKRAGSTHDIVDKIENTVELRDGIL
jgi:hypothetical protein